MLNLKEINATIDSVVKEKGKVQAKLEKLLQRREEILAPAIPKEDFINMFLEEQSLRENELSYRLFQKYGAYIYESTVRDLKIRGIQDSPLVWPKGTTDIPNDVWHIIFGEQINKALVDAINQWEWPEEVGLPRAERIKELEKIDKEIDELKAWLDHAKRLSPGQPS